MNVNISPMRFKMVFPKQSQPVQRLQPQVQRLQPQVQPKRVRFNQIPATLSMKGLFVKTGSCKACSRK